MVYGAANATQFRLRGPDAKIKEAEAILEKLPVSKPTHVVKARLKGRLLYVIPSISLSWDRLLAWFI